MLVLGFFVWRLAAVPILIASPWSGCGNDAAIQRRDTGVSDAADCEVGR